MSNDSLKIGAILTIIIIVSASDIILDLAGGGSLSHVLMETGILIMACAGFYIIAREHIQIKRLNKELQIDLERSKKDLANWKNESRNLVRGLGDAIDKQMTRWNLTPAEKEVGMLLLKGFSFKEVAQLRNTGERTSRQQSLEIYRKAGISGRAEFSAFFLEDLLLPQE